MKYDIKITYDTGDSFNTYEDIEKMLDLEQTDLVKIKANLQRIKEHYEYYRATQELNRGYYRRDEANKKRLNKIIEDAEKKPWYVPKYPDMCIIFELDCGEKFQISAFWCGYFERLVGAEIVEVLPDQSDMKISFDN